MAQLAEWCGANNLSLKGEKTNKVVMDFRRNPLTIDSSAAPNFWGCTSQRISLGPPSHSPRRHNSNYTFTASWRASFPPAILTTFYMGTIECMLTSWINVWYGNCSTADPSMDSEHSCKDHSGLFPSILAIFLTWCSSKTTSIVKDRTHLSHSLFQLLPSGRWYQSIRVCSARMHNNFFLQWLFVTPWS